MTDSQSVEQLRRFLRRAHAAERDLFGQRFLFLRAEPVVHLCVDGAERRGVDADAAGSQLLRHRPCERDEPALAGGVHRFEGTAGDAPDGGDVHDGALMSAEHQGDRGPHGEERAAEIDIHHAVPFRCRRFLKEAGGIDSGVIDETVRRAERAVRPGEELRHERFVRDIAGDGEHLRIRQGTERRLRAKKRAVRVPAGDDDPPAAGRCEPEGAGASDAARASGDENSLLHSDSFPFRAVRDRRCSHYTFHARLCPQKNAGGASRHSCGRGLNRQRSERLCR